MDYAQIKDLIHTINDSNIQEFELQMDSAVVKISKVSSTSKAAAAATSQLSASSAAPAAEHREPAHAGDEPFIVLPAEKPAELEGNVVKAPLVGAFYAKPSPDAHPFKTVGMSVAKGDVLCIIEAMKVMNEIKAECKGTIAEVCVKNAHPVEYGQVLFKVRPS